MNLRLRDHVQKILPQTTFPGKKQGKAFAPANIALCKYWGKRDLLWNLPETNSLSVSLQDLGAETTLACIESAESASDVIFLNGQPAAPAFAKRVSLFLDLFRRDPKLHYRVETHSNIPIAAGLASSAAGFAALVLALNDLYAWHLEKTQLSKFARLGSGSACRSLWQGFVEWEKGMDPEGEDSHGIPIVLDWPELRLGILILDEGEKAWSSREAMEITKKTSPFYNSWKTQVAEDLRDLKIAIADQNFVKMAEIAEANARALHATMLSATPAILYSKAKTLESWHKIWQLRSAGLEVYFTQDAGPNVKLLFLEKDLSDIQSLFPGIIVVAPFQ